MTRFAISRTAVRAVALAALCVAAAVPAQRAATAQDARGATRATVTLVTLGTFPRALADAVERGLRAELQVDVQRMNDVPLPPAAYYAPRRRYRRG